MMVMGVMAKAPMTGEVYKANFNCRVIEGVAGIAQIYTGGKLFPQFPRLYGARAVRMRWHGF